MTEEKRKPGRPKGTPKTGGKPQTKRKYKCFVCGTKFEGVPSDHPNPKRATCSRSCGGTAANLTRGGQLPVTLTCAHCGDPVTKNVSQISPTGNVFCNRECYLLWRWG